MLSGDYQQIMDMTISLHGDEGKASIIEQKQKEIDALRKLSAKMTKIFKKDKNAIEIC